MSTKPDHDAEFAAFVAALTPEGLRAYQKTLDDARDAYERRYDDVPEPRALSAEELKICKAAGCDPNVFAALKYGATPKE